MFNNIKQEFINQRRQMFSNTLTAIKKITYKWSGFKRNNTYLSYNCKTSFLRIVAKGINNTKSPLSLLFNSESKKVLNKRRKILNNYKEVIKNYNNSFIQKRLKEHASFFDGKDDNLKYPLDSDQRIAIIKDDKHNLVVAAAGSGKTSVITSRIAYLVRRKDKVNNTRILALAFTRAAAVEMQERLLKNYKININISTFHKLGRSIIAEKTQKQPKLLFDGESSSFNFQKLIRAIFYECLKQKKNQELLIEYLRDFLNEEVDFYIPEYNAYIRQYGINNNKLYNWLTMKGNGLKNDLKQYLKSQEFKKPEKNINYIHVKYSEFIERIFQLKEDTFEILKLCSTFIKLAKSNLFGPSDIKRRLENKSLNKKQVTFGKLALGIYKKYEQFLKRKDKIDFNDMINQAIDITKSDPSKYLNRYDHILIDEFQDISNQRMKLIKSFINRQSNTRLFCVGDDWQSIYRFTGSEVEFFVNFEKYFPNPEVTYLAKNYRCSQTIIKVSNKLISHNKKQINKHVIAFSKKCGKVILYEVDNISRYSAPIQVQHVYNLISNLIEKGEKTEEIMVLSRFRRINEDLRKKCIKNKIPVLNEKNKTKGIKLYTAHSSKGLEAKHVIILNAISGTYGFPCEIEDPQVLDLAKRRKGDKSFDEERRLFYVALTRTKECLYIYTHKDKRSVFLDEIKQYLKEEESIRYIEFEE
jgi:superfamily I DNA/RNA helicase